MIVAAQNEGRAVASRARYVGMAENVPRAVHTRSLAIPDAKHTIEIRLSLHMKDLAAEDRGRSEIFVHARNEMDVVLFKQRFDARESHVVSTERRTFVPGDECSGLEAGTAVAPHLRHRETHQGLDTGQIHCSAVLFVLIV